MPSRRNMQQAPINSASTGMSNIFVNPSTVAFAYVWELYLSAAGSTNLTFYNGAGALTANINVLAGNSIFMPDNGTGPHFTIDPGAALAVNDSGTVQKSGVVKYSN